MMERARLMIREQFEAYGFTGIAQALTDGECASIVKMTAAIDADGAGTRCLLAEDWCRALAGRLRQHVDIAALIPADYGTVQCTYFEKSVDRNWLVPIHQDLSIPVAKRIDHPELRGWSEKEGNLFVQPPTSVLEQLVALRVHLDPCSELDGPLQFIPGSHRAGRISADEARLQRLAGPIIGCPMEQGDVLAMRPLVLHASSKAEGSSRRRVLHFVFGPRELPYGLTWHRAV